MRSSDWSSDVCSSDLRPLVPVGERCEQQPGRLAASEKAEAEDGDDALRLRFTGVEFFQPPHDFARPLGCRARLRLNDSDDIRSEEHTSELQSLMRISYAVFCLKKKKNNTYSQQPHINIESRRIH